MDDIKFDLKELYALEARNGREFDYVRLSMADINGISRTNAVSRKHLEGYLEEEFANFVGRVATAPNGSVLVSQELKELKYGNALHVACRGTLHNCSWVALTQKDNSHEKAKWLVGEVLCEVKWPLHYKGGSFMQACPRHALRRQLHSLQKLGYQLLSAYEIEFSLLDSTTLEPVCQREYTSLTRTMAEFNDFLYTLNESAANANVDVPMMRVGGGKSSFELTMAPKHGMETSDGAFILREIVKEVASSSDLHATFMSCPSRQMKPQAAHLNLSLWTESPDGTRTNAFLDASRPDRMSSLLRHFLAGLVQHSKALCAFWCPTVNCYRRFKKSKYLSTSDWDIDNRKSTFRAKNEGSMPPYLECRKPSSACNHYLVSAATLVAGIDGIRKQTPLPAAREKLLEADEKEEEEEGGGGDDLLPTSLEEALEELEKDEVLKEGLGEVLVRWFVQLKREKEIDFLREFEGEELFQNERDLYVHFL